MLPDGDWNSPPWEVCIGTRAALVVDFAAGTDGLGLADAGLLAASEA
jgi:hypothetical protein